MRVFRVNGKTVVDYFSQETCQLPSESVVFEFTSSEWVDLTEDEINWLQFNSFTAEFNESDETFRLYFVLTTHRQRWMMFRDILHTKVDLPVAQALFAMLQRTPFELTGKTAFDFTSFLFIDLSMAMQRGNKWQFRPEQQFRVIGEPDRWAVAIIVPEHLKGLLIGSGGKTIRLVERYTEYSKNRISLNNK